MRGEGDFLVEAEGHCFFCLNKIPPPLPPFKLEPIIGLPKKIELPTPSVYSIQYFSRFLKMDMTRVFSTNESISPELLDKVERANLKVELCEECASQNTRLHKLFTHLVKIEMEIGFYAKLIHGKLVTAKTDQLSRSNGSNLTNNFLGKLEIMNALRDEAAKKCTTKFNDAIAPQVKVQNATTRQLNLERRKIKIRSRKKKCKLEPCQSPSNSFVNNDDGENDFYHDVASDGGDGDNPTLQPGTLGKRMDQQMDIVSPSKIPNELNSAPLSRPNPKTGKHKCEICSKEFTQPHTFLRHYRAVHQKIRYKCSLCSKVFARADSHRRHLKKAHVGD